MYSGCCIFATRLDYCNAVSTQVNRRLQMVLNAVARLVVSDTSPRSFAMVSLASALSPSDEAPHYSTKDSFLRDNRATRRRVAYSTYIDDDNDIDTA